MRTVTYAHVRIQRGDRVPDPPPWKFTSSMGFYTNKHLDPLEILTPPPGKCWTPTPWKMLGPLENVGPTLKPWKIIVCFEINHR